MGVFAQRQAAYTPPFDGSKPAPTLIDGGTRPPAAASEDQLAKELGVPTLPLPANGTWKIQLREYRVAGHRSHAVLALIGPDGKTVRAELNGLGNSRDFGGSGGEIQNSNSAAFTLGKAMGLDVDDAVRREGVVRKFPGWGRDLLDPRYERYVAPPTFPNAWTP